EDRPVPCGRTSQEESPMKIASWSAGLTAAVFSTALMTAPAPAHDGRNAALIGGLLAGAVLGAAASQAQPMPPPPPPRYYYGGQQPYGGGYGYRQQYAPPPPPPCGYYPYPPCY